MAKIKNNCTPAKPQGYQKVECFDAGSLVESDDGDLFLVADNGNKFIIDLEDGSSYGSTNGGNTWSRVRLVNRDIVLSNDNC